MDVDFRGLLPTVQSNCAVPLELSYSLPSKWEVLLTLIPKRDPLARLYLIHVLTFPDIVTSPVTRGTIIAH